MNYEEGFHRGVDLPTLCFQLERRQAVTQIKIELRRLSQGRAIAELTLSCLVAIKWCEKPQI